MKVDQDLLGISYFVLAGDEESVNLIDITSCGDYPWILYILPGAYDTSLGWGRSMSSSLNSGLFTYLLNNNETKFDFFGTIPGAKKFTIDNYVCQRGSVYRYLEKAQGESINSDCIKLDKTHIALLTPFLGVDTELPLSLGLSTLASLIAICSSPTSTHGVLVGDCDAARTLLGSGLQGFRSVILNYLGVKPSNSSIPIDVSIPLIYSEYRDRSPCIVDVLQAQTLSDKGTKQYYMLASVVRLFSCLYSLIDIDHGYRGLEVLQPTGAPFPSDWYVFNTSASKSQVPFRYPALVSLLAATSRKVESVEKYQLRDIDRLLEVSLADSLLSKIGILKATADDSMALFGYLPKLCKSFFVQLYRITCKDVINIPDSKRYPRRSAYNKAFVTTYTEYAENNTLSSYMELAELLIQSSIGSKEDNLGQVVSFCDHNAYEIVNDPNLIPPIPISGNVIRHTPNNLIPWKHYMDKKSRCGGILLKSELGQVMSVDAILDESVEILLNSVEQLCNTDEVYRVVNHRSVDELTSSYSYKPCLDDSMVESNLAARISFTNSPLFIVSLRDIVEYHRHVNHGGTRKIIETVIAILNAQTLNSIVSVTNSNSIHSYGVFDYQSSILSLKQYLEKVLDSSRV